MKTKLHPLITAAILVGIPALAPAQLLLDTFNSDTPGTNVRTSTNPAPTNWTQLAQTASPLSSLAVDGGVNSPFSPTGIGNSMLMYDSNTGGSRLEARRNFSTISLATPVEYQFDFRLNSASGLVSANGDNLIALFVNADSTPVAGFKVTRSGGITYMQTTGGALVKYSDNSNVTFSLDTWYRVNLSLAAAQDYTSSGVSYTFTVTPDGGSAKSGSLTTLAATSSSGYANAWFYSGIGGTSTTDTNIDNVSVIPEPSTTLLLGLAAGIAVVLRRRHRAEA